MQKSTDDVILGGSREPVAYSPEDRFLLKVDDLDKIGAGPTLRKAFEGVEGAKTKARHEKSRVTAYDAFDVAQPLHNQDYLVKMYEDYTNYAAINAKVANVVGLGYDLIESEKTLEKEDQIDDDSEELQNFRRKLARAKRLMFKRLDNFNAEDEFMEILEKIVIDYEVMGNAYLEIGRTAAGSIGYIGHVPAKTIRVRRKRDGFVQFASDVPVFFRRYGDTSTKNPFKNDPRPNELIHFKKYTPADNYYGAPDIIPALSAVVGNRFADEFNLDYFENKAVPRNIILVRGGNLSDEAQGKLMRFFGEDLRGKHHRALYVPLPADTREEKHSFEIKAVETGVQDSAFREYSRGNTEKILMVHRVPSSKLGITTDAALAAAKDFDKTFKEQTCRPIQRVIEKKINRILSEITNVFKFKLNELDLVDEVSQAQIDRLYHALGAITANEIRTRQGRPGLESGDMTIWEIHEREAKRGANNANRAEARVNSTMARQREIDRAVERTDSVGAARNPKGEGRTHKN